MYSVYYSREAHNNTPTSDFLSISAILSAPVFTWGKAILGGGLVVWTDGKDVLLGVSCIILGDVSDLPGTVSDFPEDVSDLPRTVSDFPGDISDLPTDVSDFLGFRNVPVKPYTMNIIMNSMRGYCTLN